MPQIRHDLCELDGHEFLVTEDNEALVSFSCPEDPYQPWDYSFINSVMFRGEDVLPRLTDDEKEGILMTICDPDTMTLEEEAKEQHAEYLHDRMKEEGF